MINNNKEVSALSAFLKPMIEADKDLKVAIMLRDLIIINLLKKFWSLFLMPKTAISPITTQVLNNNLNFSSFQALPPTSLPQLMTKFTI